MSGLLYAPRDHEDLCRAVAMIADSPEMVASMRIKARQRYEAMYMPATNLNALENIYREAIEEMRGRKVTAYG